MNLLLNYFKNKKFFKTLIIGTVILSLFVVLVACQSDNTPESETVEETEQTENHETLDAQTEKEESEQSADDQDGEDKTSDELTQITFALDWLPNTNHSGLYLARDLGFYEEEGLEVDLVMSDMNFIEMVAVGSAELGIASQEQILQARASFAEVPVVAVAAIMQHNTSGFASPVDREIKSPADFAGKTYSGWGTDLELAFISHLMDADNASIEDVDIITMSATNFIQSMEIEADFAWIYWAWDGILSEYSDYPIDFILLQDIVPDLDFYSPNIIASEALIEENPDLISAFLRATKKGYEYAIDNPEEAVDALINEAPELEREFLLESQDYINTQYIADADIWGQMTDERWQTFYDWMLENDLLESELDLEEAYTLEFIPE